MSCELAGYLFKLCLKIIGVWCSVDMLHVTYVCTLTYIYVW